MSDTINSGGPAFPTKAFTRDGTPNGHAMGMSLRDHFAGQAMAAIVGSPNYDWLTSSEGMVRTKSAAIFAYEFADAMLKAREDAQ